MNTQSINMLIIKSFLLIFACGLVVNAQNSHLLKSFGRTKYFFPYNEYVFEETGLGHRIVSLNLFFDTGLSQSWVLSTECQEPRCLGHARYNSSLSPSPHPLGTYQEVNYGSLGVVRGELFEDDLYLRDRLVNGFKFVAAINLPNEEILPRGLDGMIGLDLPTFQHNATYKNPIQLMIEQRILSRALFTLYFNSHGNEHRQTVVFGPVPQHWTPMPILYLPLSHSDRWQFHLDEITVRESKGHDVIGVCQNGCEAIISSGLPVVLGPSDEVRRLNEQIGSNRTEDGRFLLPNCNISHLPDIVFRTSVKDFVLSPNQYVMQIDSSPNSCISGIFEGSESAWVLGQNFLTPYVITFDYSNQRVGFAGPAELQ